MLRSLCMIFLFLPQVFFASTQYTLSVCAISRDEVDYLKEWVDFYLDHGVEHFWIYNNLSVEDYQSVLKPYIDKGIVELIDWPYESTGQDFFQIQCDAYKDCVNRALGKSMWVALLDTDEFLFCPHEKDLKKFLKNYSDFGSVSAFWRMYGTSNINVQKGEKLTKRLVYRAKDDNAAHILMKTVAQPKYIHNIWNPHFVIHKEGKTNLQLNVEDLRINHYWSRDIDFFYNKKLPRREKWYGDRELHIKWESEMNEVYDPILANNFIPLP